MLPYKQLSLADIFSDCQNIFNTDKPEFLSLLETYITLDEIVPASFFLHYYSSTGRSRKYPLTAMLWVLIIQRIFSIPTDKLLLTFFALFQGLRTQNEKTLHADLLLAGITQLITLVLADKIQHHEYIHSLKPLIA